MITKDILTFGRLFTGSTSKYNQIITTYIPNPNTNLYKRGYIDRYFVQKCNDMDSYVYEIEKNVYDTFLNNPFYSVASLKWRITGNLNEVIESNRISLQIACEQLPALKLYLPNLLQFHKENLEK